jgi:FtsP/CotA-like multicopper oxidase with cupredoxin domain
MSRNQRVALVVGAVLVAVIAFVAVSPGDDDDGSKQATETTTTTATGGATTAKDSVTPSEPAAERIQLRGGEVVGGPKTIKVTKGDRVRIVVSADAEDDIHLHGYDIEKKVQPGKPARFDLVASIEGQFEMESHVAEDAGREPLVASLVVEPS